MTQKHYLHMIKAKNKCQNVPNSILEAAFQPTAHGGLLHFAAGNICLVDLACSFLSKAARNEAFQNPIFAVEWDLTGGSRDISDLWRDYMNDHWGLEATTSDSEKLYIEGQHIYTCPACNSFL
jgi:hypothetical protein